MTFKVKDKVKHDFSGEIGTVLDVRRDPRGYDYYVEWDKTGEKDWYKIKVLEAVS